MVVAAFFAVRARVPRRQLGDGRARLVITKTSLGKIDPGYVRGILYASEDCNTIAYVVKRGDKQAVVYRGGVGAEYDQVGKGEVPYIHLSSPDGKRIAYLARRKDKWLVVLDGEESVEYDEVSPGGQPRNPRFSADGRHFAYAARRGGEYFVVLDERESLAYDEVGVNPWPGTADGPLAVLFSPDGGRLAFSARRGGKWFAVVDGEEIGEYGGIGPLAFSADARHFAYAAMRAESWFVVLDGEEIGNYDELGPLTFSPDGRHFAYAAKRRDKWFVVRDGREGTEYDDVAGQEDWWHDWDLGPEFSPDSLHLAYVAKLRPWEFVVLDGVESKKPFWDARLLRFSPHGRRLFCVAESSKGQCVVVDGEQGKDYQKVFAVSFSPDEKHVAYETQRSEWPFYSRWSERLHDTTGWSIFHTERQFKALMVVDGVEGPGYEWTYGPFFSEDSKHVGYVGKRGGRYFGIVDGLEVQEIPGPSGHLGWRTESPITLLFISDNEEDFMRYEMRLVPE